MKLAIKLGILSALACGFVVAACSDDEGGTQGPTTTTSNNSSSSTGTASGGGGAGGGIPAIPTLGVQVDRMGRPAINTALNNTFADDATRGMAEDAWNANSTQANWQTDHGPDVRAGLALLDALNAVSATMNGCGDQVGYGALGNPDYLTLATVLTNDWIVVKGDAADGCNIYLGVEATGLGVANDDCGGRTPLYDVIETSYSAISGVGLSGFDDTIAVKQETADAFAAGFPYLAAPNAQ